MQFTLTAIATVVAAAIASAAPTAAPQSGTPDQPVTGPFALKVECSNSTWNGKYLSNVHIGAAINLAVPVSTPDKFYYLNSTSDGWVSNGIQYGRLTWPTNPSIPFQGGLEIDYTSNIAALLISVLEPTTFNFGSGKYLQIEGAERWFVCTIPTSYGPMAGFGWEFGTGATSIGDCESVRLVRVD